MTSHYKRIGDYVTQIKTKNTNGTISSLKGININKHFMPSVANVNGTDLSTYRVVKKNQFAFNPMHVGRDEVLPIALLEDDEPVIVSPAYIVFEVNDEQELLPAYLMMWCSRSEFDRNAWFMTDNSVRGGFSWDDFCELKLPIPSIEKQREIVREYNVVNDRIALNEQLIQKLEDTAQAIYKQWFVDFEFPISKEHAESIGKPELEGQPYKSSSGEMKYCDEIANEIPKNWSTQVLSNITNNHDSERIPLSKDLRDQMPDNYRYYGAASLMGYVKDYIYDGIYILLGEDGTVVTDNGTPVLQYVEGKFWVNNHAHVLSSNHKHISPALLYLILNNTSVSEIITGGVQAKINQKNLNSLKIIVPDNHTLIQQNPYFVKIRHAIESYKNMNNSLVKLKLLLKDQMV